MAKSACPRVFRKQRLNSLKARSDPVVVPCRNRSLVVTELVRQVAQHPKIVDRVDVAGDDAGERTHPRPTLRVDAQVIGPALIVAPQMDRGGFVSELFQIEGDADAERGRGPEIPV